MSSTINKFGTYGTGTGTGPRGPRGPPGVMTVDAGLKLINSNLSLDFDYQNIVNYHTSNTNPTVNDINYPLGRIWVNTLNSKAYVLCSIVENMALWKEITNTTAEQLPPMTVYPDGSSIAMRDADGQSWFQNIYLKSLADGVNKKILKVSTDKVGEMPTGLLVAENISGSEIDSTSDINVHGLKVNGLSAGYLTADANGDVTSQALQIPANITVTSISGTGDVDVQFPNSLSTNFIQTYNNNKVECLNDLHMYGTTSLYLENLKSKSILGTDANGKIIATNTSTTISADTINPSTPTTTPSGLASGTIAFNGDILINGGNELRFAQTTSAPYPQMDKSKIVFFDDRLASAYKYYSIGTDLLPKNNAFGMIFHSGGLTRGFEWMGMNRDDPAQATGDVSHMALINKTLYIDNIASLTTGGNINCSSNLAMGSNEIIFATSQVNDPNRIVLTNQRGDGPFKWWGIGSGTGGVTDVGINANYHGTNFHVGYWGAPFKWTRVINDDSTYSTAKTSMMLTSDILQIDKIQALAGVNSVLEMKSPLKLSATGYSTAGYLYRNADGTTEMKTPSTYTNTDLLISNSDTTLLLYKNATSSSATSTNTTAIGCLSGASLTTGSNNTLIGYKSGNSLTTGGANICIGDSAGLSLSNTANFNIDIGHIGVAGDSGKIRIGTPSVQTDTYITGIYNRTFDSATNAQVYVDATGKLYTSTSSRRYKENIRPMEDTSFIYSLEPVNFNYIKDTTKTKQYGLIAEDTNNICPDLVRYNDEGLPEAIQEHKIQFMLLNELKKLKAEVETLKAKVTQLENNNVTYKTTAPQLSEVGQNNLILFKDDTTTNLNAAYKIPGGTKIIDLVTNS